MTIVESISEWEFFKSLESARRRGIRVKAIRLSKDVFGYKTIPPLWKLTWNGVDVELV